MLLPDKTAVVYGACGAIGAAVSRAFAKQGAKVILVGRTRPPFEAVAAAIRDAGSSADLAVLDALDASAVSQHADAVAERTGRIDIALNAVGIAHQQGTPFADLSFDDFCVPVAGYLKSVFVTSQAVAQHMARQRSGVILTLSSPGAKVSGTGFFGNGVSGAAASMTGTVANLTAGFVLD